MKLKSKISHIKDRMKAEYEKASEQVDPKPEEQKRLNELQKDEIVKHINAAIDLYKYSLDLDHLNSAMLVCCAVIDGMDKLSGLDLSAGLYKRQIKKCYENYPDQDEFFEKVQLFTDKMLGELDGQGSPKGKDT